ncbi:hypothetical protein C8F01DRAFT_1252526 [Mycena amicta]|nr:hypothetical protein C8F01DRAFT_1252526 [Mycena amicta]
MGPVLAEFPSLTHLALYGCPSTDLCTLLLSLCQPLRVLLLVQDAAMKNSHREEFPPALTVDPRLLVMTVDTDCNGGRDWELGALNGFSHDTWTRADAFVEERKNGAVPRDNFILPPI